MLARSPAEFGHVARHARRHLGLTQAQLAERVGVSRKWIVDFEAGKRAAELSLVLRTLNVLGLELDVRTRSGSSALDAVIPPPPGSR